MRTANRARESLTVARTDTTGVPAEAQPTIRLLANAYLRCLTGLLNSIDLRRVEAAVTSLRHARDVGASVFVIGNGGSAATASHFATDLVNMSKRAGARPLKVMSLVDNAAWLTAQANDTGYDNVFAGQLETFAARGDVLIAISASGNSPSILTAVEVARGRAMTIIALVGFDGGMLVDAADIAIHVRSTPGLYGPVEDVHLALQHIISGCLAEV